MNLNYPYDKASLMALTQTADKKSDIHTLVIDFDGEVVLDPEIHFPGVEVSRYKFHTEIEDKSLRDVTSLAALYDSLEEMFNANEQRHSIGEKRNRLAA